MYPHYFYGNNWMSFGGFFFGGFMFLFFTALAVWSIYWKGKALWHAARVGHTNWFIVLLVINTAGILDILYLWVFSKKVKHRTHTS